MITDESARDAAAEILSANEFTRWYTDYESWLAMLERIGELVPDWLLQVFSWIGSAVSAFFRFLARIMEFFGVFGDVNSGIGWIAMGILAAALFVLLWQRRLRRESGLAINAGQRTPGHEHATALRDAIALAKAGHYLEAAHRVQLATLALLIEFDWLELARSDPNRTLRERVRSSSLPERERVQLVELVDRLESLWFDEPRDDRVLFEDWVSLDKRIVAIGSGRPA